jgi:hypothetical protein
MQEIVRQNTTCLGEESRRVSGMWRPTANISLMSASKLFLLILFLLYKSPRQIFCSIVVFVFLLISYVAIACAWVGGSRFAARQLNKLVLAQLVEVKGKRARKRQQMGVVFHLLSQGLPLLEFQALREMLKFLGVQKMP